MTRTKMRKELLLGTVALMAGIGLASAQGLREGGSAGGSERGMSSGSSQMSPPSGESAGAKSEGAKVNAAKSQSKSESRGEGAAAGESSRGERQLNRWSGPARGIHEGIESIQGIEWPGQERAAVNDRTGRR